MFRLQNSALPSKRHTKQKSFLSPSHIPGNRHNQYFAQTEKVRLWTQCPLCYPDWHLKWSLQSSKSLLGKSTLTSNLLQPPNFLPMSTMTMAARNLHKVFKETLPKSHYLGAMYQQYYRTGAGHLQMAKIRGYFLVYTLTGPLSLEKHLFPLNMKQTKRSKPTLNKSSTWSSASTTAFQFVKSLKTNKADIKQHPSNLATTAKVHEWLQAL